MTGCALAPPRQASGVSRIAVAVVTAWLLGALPSAALPIFPATATQVPEPSTMALIALAVVAVLARQIRKLRRTRPARLN